MQYATVSVTGLLNAWQIPAELVDISPLLKLRFVAQQGTIVNLHCFDFPSPECASATLDFLADVAQPTDVEGLADRVVDILVGSQILGLLNVDIVGQKAEVQSNFVVDNVSTKKMFYFLKAFEGVTDANFRNL